MTLAEVWGVFCLHLHAAGRSPQTVRSYHARFRQFVSHPEIEPNMEMCQITPELLDRFAASLRDPVRQLSDASRLGYIQTLKTFFAFAHRRGYVGTDVGADLSRPKLNHDARGRLMSVPDLYRMLDVASDAAAQGRPRDLALVMFLADTGCRRGEAAGLVLSCLRLDKLEATVSGKTGIRDVDYTAATAAALKMWLDVRRPAEHDYVFTGQGNANMGGPLNPRALNDILHRLAHRAGVRGRYNPQSLRHLVGQTWTDRVNLELVRMKLGHSSVTTTAMFYAHQDMERVKAATGLNSLLNHYGGSND